MTSWSSPEARDGSGFEAHGLTENLVVSKRDALADLDGASIVGEACACVHIQAPKQLGVHEVGRREAPAVHHNVGNGTQVVRARVGDLHFEACNLVARDLALFDTDVGGVTGLERAHLAMHCFPATLLCNLGARGRKLGLATKEPGKLQIAKPSREEPKTFAL